MATKHTYRTLDQVGRALARRRGIKGNGGGWLYDRLGRRFGQGYVEYARKLVFMGQIAMVEGGYQITDAGDARTVEIVAEVERRAAMREAAAAEREEVRRAQARQIMALRGFAPGAKFGLAPDGIEIWG